MGCPQTRWDENGSSMGIGKDFRYMDKEKICRRRVVTIRGLFPLPLSPPPFIQEKYDKKNYKKKLKTTRQCNISTLQSNFSNRKKHI